MLCENLRMTFNCVPRRAVWGERHRVAEVDEDDVRQELLQTQVTACERQVRALRRGAQCTHEPLKKNPTQGPAYPQGVVT